MAEPEKKNYRETLLILFLIIFLGGTGAFFLYFLTLGFLGHVLLAVAGITLVGFLHYSLWGRTMTQEISQERDDKNISGEMEEWWEKPANGPIHHRRF
jgi:hypothetical protein